VPSPFRIYNTKSRQIEAFSPIKPGHVGLYVCGMTVYDRAHTGHARAMVVFDTFVRYLRHRQWEVTFIRNFTDVDDKIIRRAGELGIDAAELANSEIEAFHRDAAALGLAPPTAEPRVTESIDAIVAMIGRLVEQDHAYVVEGCVWFSVRTCDTYGALSGQKVDQLRSADTAPGKRDSADFALWKASKPGEPSWPSPWGEGRPGWHVECSAMALETLGATIDIHGGGLDLVFPHHENEIAQSECCNRQPYANYWMHNGLLTVTGGQKMGKSLGNVVNIEEVVRLFPAESVRLYYLQDQYRSPIPWIGEALPEALSMLSRLYDAREAAESMAGSEDAHKVASELGADAQAVLEQASTFEERCHAALDEDFNTAKALAHAFSLARAVNRLAAHKRAKKRGGPVVAPALSAFRLVGQALGLMQHTSAEFEEEVKNKRLEPLGLSRREVDSAVSEREAHRHAKRWEQADQIRQQLEAQGIVVMDTPEGSRWRVQLSGGAV
jgi:cysteinyl-tRNA synthetase